jgi:hypothetical protein
MIVPVALPEPTDSFRRLVARLSDASVRRHWEAYRDIEWDAPEHEIRPDDARWEAREAWDPLAASPWYRDQSPADRAALGLSRQAVLMKLSIEFEAVLSEGLLRFAARLPDGHPAFRYVYHEITEEAEHSMMFQEFINRSGVALGPLADGAEMYGKIAAAAATSPVLFFVAVLSGEEAFDRIQRLMLTSSSLHPLAERIGRIHVTEEARHVSFARALLRDLVPRLPSREVRSLRYQLPFVIEWTADHLFTSAEVLAPAAGVPEPARHAIAADERFGSIRRAGTARIVALCEELGLVDRRVEAVWSRLR